MVEVVVVIDVVVVLTVLVVLVLVLAVLVLVVVVGVGVVDTVVVESMGGKEVVVKLDVELQFVQGKSKPYCGDGKPEEKITEEIEV